MVTVQHMDQQVEILPPAPDKPWLWRKGQSGNPEGQAAHTKHEVLALARMNSVAALKVIVGLMDDPKAGKAVQLAAAVHILDRAFGKPKQTVDVEQQGRSLEQILMAIAAARQAEQAPEAGGTQGG